MFYTIYKITNKINGKYYIGKHQTSNLDDNYMGSGKLIKRAIQKHGLENFTKEILHIFDNEIDMNNKEKELVILNEDSYNLCPGGHGGFGYINSNEKLRIEKNKKARKIADITLKERYGITNPSQLEHVKRFISDNTKLRHAQGKLKAPDWTGKVHSQETKDKIGLKNSANTGSRNSQYGTCWITNGKENKKIKKEDIDKYIEFGYYKGRIIAGVV